MLITGNLDLLPNASIIPIGKAKAIPVQPRTSVTRRPPHLLVDTSVKPKPPLSTFYMEVFYTKEVAMIMLTLHKLYLLSKLQPLDKIHK